MRIFDPPHPGEILREDCLKPLSLTVTAAAKGLGVSRGSLSELLNGHNGVSADMAIHLIFEAMSFHRFALPVHVQALRFMAPYYDDRANEGANEPSRSTYPTLMIPHTMASAPTRRRASRFTAIAMPPTSANATHGINTSSPFEGSTSTA